MKPDRCRLVLSGSSEGLEHCRSDVKRHKSFVASLPFCQEAVSVVTVGTVKDHRIISQ